MKSDPHVQNETHSITATKTSDGFSGNFKLRAFKSDYSPINFLVSKAKWENQLRAPSTHSLILSKRTPSVP